MSMTGPVNPVGADAADTVSLVASAECVVTASGVTKTYGDVVALDRVDLRVQPGTVHALIGPNGAGKTTLLSILFGLVLPDGGELQLFGRSWVEAGARWLDGVGGFVESPRFYPYRTGRQNLELLAGLDGGDASTLVTDLLDLVGLGGAGGIKVRGYSLGMRQRLGLAASLLRRPRLLILDEPTSGMDPAGVRDLLAAIKQLVREGLTVILSSHDMAHVEEISNTVTVLHRGSVVFSGSLDTMRAGAPDPAWRLATSADEDALTIARDLGGVKATGSDGGGLRVLAVQEELDEYVIRLGQRGVAVRSLALDVTPLESMFFELTGGAPGEASFRPALDFEAGHGS
jgi:ABC-2 type transport system ATP-binding protein